VFAPVTLSDAAKRLSTGSIDAELDWQTLVEKGARGRSENTDKAAWKSAKLGVVDLVDEPRKTVEYRTGTPNFFAITHYNRSYFYAASVADLASALAKRRGVPDHSEYAYSCLADAAGLAEEAAFNVRPAACNVAVL